MNLVHPMKQAMNMNCMPVKVIVSPRVIEEEEIVVCHIYYGNNSRRNHLLSFHRIPKDGILKKKWEDTKGQGTI